MAFPTYQKVLIKIIQRFKTVKFKFGYYIFKKYQNQTLRKTLNL